MADLKVVPQSSRDQRAVAAIDSGGTLSGLRVSDGNNGEGGHVVLLTPEEQKPVLAAIRDVLKARG